MNSATGVPARCGVPPAAGSPTGPRFRKPSPTQREQRAQRATCDYYENTHDQNLHHAEPNRPHGVATESPEDGRRLGEHAGVRRHARTQQRVGVRDDGADGEGDRRRPSFADDRRDRRRRVPQNVCWGKCRDAQPHFVADPHARDVALIDAELELERIGAAHDGEDVARLGVRSHAFLGPSGEHDALNRRANHARANLFVEQLDVAAENIGA